MSSLTALRIISNYDMRLSGSLPNISTTTSITYISLAGYNIQSNISGTIEGFINQIQSLSALSVIYMAKGKVSGTLPIEQGVLNKAVTLMSFSKHRFSGLVPISFSMYPNVQIMQWDLNSNISGTIPSAFGSLTALRQMFLGNCSVSGTIPSELGKSSTLLLLDLHSNKLSGSSAPEFSSWHTLILISLFGNSVDWDLALIYHWKQTQ